ncbi:hypothetical protein B5G50_21485 [Brevibacillus brevis]|nr:hypothetical protein B5G50_21485 [Brevibacillus brevis]
MFFGVEFRRDFEVDKFSIKNFYLMDDKIYGIRLKNLHPLYQLVRDLERQSEETGNYDVQLALEKLTKFEHGFRVIIKTL